jgi:hypothetical protein
MPNGRSGGFGLTKATLEQILCALPAIAVIGRSTVSPGVDVSAVLRMVSEYPGDVIGVEEQDYRWYIMHLEPGDVDPPNAEKWIMIGSESPLFKDLRREHLKFESETRGK